MATLAPPAPIVPTPTAAQGAPPPARERLLSLDVFRGMTVAGMLLVNNPGSWATIFPPLEHAKWHGWTPTDLVFPFFLFIVGVTAHLSLAGRRARGDDDATLVRAVVRRAAIIFALGLALNAFPFFQWGKVGDLVDPSFLDRVLWRLDHLRVFGVLQRIALAYLLGALLTLRGTWRAHVAWCAALLLGYWAIMTLVPVPDTGLMGWQSLDDPAKPLSAWLDRLLLGDRHIWIGGKTWDPEGLLAAVPAAGTVILGNLAGRWIGTPATLAERLNGLFAVGALCMMAGLAWHWVFPINKNLWTSSYVVFTGGMASVTLATCMWLIDVRGWRPGVRFFQVYGTNPLVAFVGSGIMARLTVSILKVEGPNGPISVSALLYNTAFAPWLPPRVASLAYALAFVSVWYVILLALWKRGIVLKV
jgi:predicted acyltransferase